MTENCIAQCLLFKQQYGKYTIKKNGPKQYQNRVLLWLVITEPFLVLNRTLFIWFHKESCFESAIRDLNGVIDLGWGNNDAVQTFR